MLKAIAHADKERAVNVEESNDATGYRTLSCVLMEETLSEQNVNIIAWKWRESAGDDSLLSHCAGNLTVPDLRLLLSFTLRRSAPMLAWRLDLLDIIS